MAWQILVVEDEEWAWDSLRDMLALLLLAENPKLIRLDTVRDAVNWLRNNNPDLIFMDIHLADGISLDVFKQVPVSAPVIFTTAYDEYALDAFQNQGYAYLLKPFDQEDMEQAIAKVRKLLPSDEPHYKSRFLVKYGIHLKSLPVDDIAYFMAEDKTLFAVEKAGGRYIIEDTLMGIATKLDPASFFQINRKFMVHIDAIVSMLKISRGRVKVKLVPEQNEDVIVSQERSLLFQEWLGR
ncbi:LytR/AlgR family response regulator transcription factor [Sphingobacterium corticibacterium]|uniref:Response regulator n=1 Tax=Sphingobacterium corticibacterium TaxID=2484746 RepID=A0A4Q6XPJ4_9SPHI|nr:LytTR family transcriptional regulator DNA-binding domain-containing protein [Sphingobacterium corticibacterium]RZF62163.1 response regulator [Sphingobacterium corticibacterium]